VLLYLLQLTINSW